MDASALRLVKAIGDTGSFTGAAAALGLSQPAVSQRVRRLEREAGTALVERSGRRTRLTQAGEVLARHASTVLATLAAAEEEVAAVAGLRAGRVRLVAFPSSSATLLPRALRLLRDRHPGLRVSFAEAEPPGSLADLREGTYDVALAFSYPGADLGRGEDDLAGLVAVPLLADPLLVALPEEHPLAGAAAVDLAALAGETWIAGCPRCRGHLLQAAAAAGFAPEVAFATDDYVAMLGLVEAGLGVALVPALVQRTARHHRVVVRPLDPPAERQVVAVTTEGLVRVPAVAATLAALREVAAHP
ncbi:LysR family transcriptional regulator [Vallicoccus soli]|uniref:LysR family transcriptional regulator n=1 Tax=Vallicoccus soli TaxID=2339232 RepID=A0A3A3YXQ4_9ACTN|nr:LysR family transcriptional regulator [Vallicoccus soli]RJK96459.1 LysR family transcriptional regulator [Vallicoccus soli]